MNERIEIRLTCGKEALELVQRLSELEEEFYIENHTGSRRVNAKSILGVMYTMFAFHDGMFLVRAGRAGEMPACVATFAVNPA